MPFITQNNLRIFQFETFQTRNLIHGIFTRHGGVSPSPWDSLNVGSLVGDDPVNVITNRDRSVTALDRGPSTLYEVWQVHGNDVVVSDRPRDPAMEHRKADGILTGSKDVTLYMRFADCVPILLYDPEKQICGIVHAGWQGTINKVIIHTIERMKNEFSSRPENILAGIGPSIGPDRYEVGENVIEAANEAFNLDREKVLKSINGSVHFDLWEANRVLLQQCGVESIEVAGVCTASNPQDWFSHRGENGKTGRFGAVIGLE